MNENMLPEKPIFTKKTDDSGREYFTAYANKITNCVVSHGDKNLVLKGNPKINLRIGESVFDDEIFIELLCMGEVRATKKNSDYDTVEIYFPKGFGLDFFKKFIYFVENDVNKQKQLEI